MSCISVSGSQGSTERHCPDRRFETSSGSGQLGDPLSGRIGLDGGRRQHRGPVRDERHGRRQPPAVAIKKCQRRDSPTVANKVFSEFHKFVFVYPSICLSVCLSIRLFVYPSVCLSVCLCVKWQFVCCLFVYLFVCLFVYLSVCHLY